MNVNAVIREVAALVRGELMRHRVSLRTDLAEALPPVHGDRVQLQQVILNLLINGIEAMTGVDERSRELSVRSWYAETGVVVVAVHDSGRGLSPGDLDVIFSSFYTTKPDGMGIGLSVSRAIIEAHGGRLWASPHDGTGATFQFSLPALRKERGVA